jgi:uncharacterized membrane protein
VSAATPGRAGTDAAWALEAAIGRLLVAGTWTAMALIAVGVALTLASGVDPLAHGPIPPFDLGSIPSELIALQPAGFLWAGIVLVIALPVGRVVVAGLGFLGAREWRLALISLAVLLVVLVSIGAALGLEG